MNGEYYIDETIKATEVAFTIYRQLGGLRFREMTGSYEFKCYDNSLSMHLRRNKASANYLIINLEPNDTYTMEFIRLWVNRTKVVAKFTDVYFDQLQEIFTSVTGLDTHL